MKNLHIVISFLAICCLLSVFDGFPSIAGFFLILFSFLGLLRVLDPLLGCVISDEQNKFSSGMAYVIVFTFAVSSGLDPSRYSNYILPEAFVGSFFFGVVAYTSLNLRMAYYKRFCFRHELSLESQLRLVLIPLMVLAVHQMFSALNSIDLQSVFGV